MKSIWKKFFFYHKRLSLFYLKKLWWHAQLLQKLHIFLLLLLPFLLYLIKKKEKSGNGEECFNKVHLQSTNNLHAKRVRRPIRGCRGDIRLMVLQRRCWNRAVYFSFPSYLSLPQTSSLFTSRHVRTISTLLHFMTEPVDSSSSKCQFSIVTTLSVFCCCVSSRNHFERNWNFPSHPILSLSFFFFSFYRTNFHIFKPASSVILPSSKFLGTIINLDLGFYLKMAI